MLLDWSRNVRPKMSQERFQLLLFWKLSKTNEEIAFQITVPVIISPQIFLQFEMKILLRKPIDLLETVFSSNFFFLAKRLWAKGLKALYISLNIQVSFLLWLMKNIWSSFLLNFISETFRSKLLNKFDYFHTCKKSMAFQELSNWS